jgi:hypothetical protein
VTLGSKWTKALTFENVVVAAVELAVLLFCCYFVASLLLTNAVVAAVELVLRLSNLLCFAITETGTYLKLAKMPRGTNCSKVFYQEKRLSKFTYRLKPL